MIMVYNLLKQKSKKKTSRNMLFPGSKIKLSEDGPICAQRILRLSI